MFKHSKADNKIDDALGHIRAAAQELHGAISDAAAKRGGAVKADVQAASSMAKALTDSVKDAIDGQNEATKKHLAEAVTHLEAAQKHATESLKSSDQAFHSSVRQSLTNARAAVQKVSEAIATARSAHPVIATTVGIGALLAGEAIVAKHSGASTHSRK